MCEIYFLEENKLLFLEIRNKDDKRVTINIPIFIGMKYSKDLKDR